MFDVIVDALRKMKESGEITVATITVAVNKETVDFLLYKVSGRDVSVKGRLDDLAGVYATAVAAWGGAPDPLAEEQDDE